MPYREDQTMTKWKLLARVRINGRSELVSYYANLVDESGPSMPIVRMSYLNNIRLDTAKRYGVGPIDVHIDFFAVVLADEEPVA
jgi:hypothetical protein